MSDEQLWPTPRYAEEIVFEGRARLAIAPEEYEALYNAHEALRAQLEQAQREIKFRRETGCSPCTVEDGKDGPFTFVPVCESLKDTIARQRAWIESAGHRPGCAITKCKAYPGCSGEQYSPVHSARHFAFEHVFIPSPCDCGFAELVGG